LSAAIVVGEDANNGTKIYKINEAAKPLNFL